MLQHFLTMEKPSTMRQKGFLIRDLLESSSADSRKATRTLDTGRHLGPVKHITLLNRESDPDLVSETTKSISNFKTLFLLSQQQAASGVLNRPRNDTVVADRAQNKVQNESDNGDVLNTHSKEDQGSPDGDVRDTMRVTIQRPIPGLPRLLLGSSPLRMPHLPELYRDPRLFRIPGAQNVPPRCPCAIPDCHDNWTHLDQGCRLFKDLYSGDQLFELKDTLPVPVPLPFYVRMRADSLACDGCFKTKKCRRSRTVFTELQLMGLEKRFETQKYLSTPDRMDLAEKLGLTQIQVKTWYQNRRMKWKKQVLQDGGTEAPTKPKGRPRKIQNSSEGEPEVIV